MVEKVKKKVVLRGLYLKSFRAADKFRREMWLAATGEVAERLKATVC